MAARIWLHSDWHWGHENIYTFTYTGTDGKEHRVREGFTQAIDGDAYMEARWRDLIQPSDHVWCLGDLTMFRGGHPRIPAFVKFFKSLPGHKRLILGNHDHLPMSTYVEAGFEKIQGSMVINHHLLTHYPVHPTSLSFRIKGNIHGHTHQRPDESPQHLNVSVERTSFEPILLDVAVAQLEDKREDAASGAAARPRLVDVSGNLIGGAV